jgi:hypothetical protein
VLKLLVGIVELDGIGVGTSDILLPWLDAPPLTDGLHLDDVFQGPLNQAGAWLCIVVFVATSPTSRLLPKETIEKFWERPKVAEGVIISLSVHV